MNYFDAADDTTIPTTLRDRMKFIESIEDIPAMPDIVMQLLEKLNNPEIKFREVEHLLSLDPGLASYLLRIANSPLLGLRTEVLTLAKAIMVVGLTNLKSLLIAYGIRHLYKSVGSQEMQQILWRHAVFTGVIAKIASEEIFKVVHSQVYVMGLLHDVGKIILLILNTNKFRKSFEQVLSGEEDAPEAEFRFYGYSHIETGFFMLNKLGFSRAMKDVVLYHHNPEFASSGDQLIWIVSLANNLSHHLEGMKDLGKMKLERYLAKLGLTNRLIEKIVKKGGEQATQYLSLY